MPCHVIGHEHHVHVYLVRPLLAQKMQRFELFLCSMKRAVCSSMDNAERAFNVGLQFAVPWWQVAPVAGQHKVPMSTQMPTSWKTCRQMKQWKCRGNFNETEKNMETEIEIRLRTIYYLMSECASAVTLTSGWCITMDNLTPTVQILRGMGAMLEFNLRSWQCQICPGGTIQFGCIQFHGSSLNFCDLIETGGKACFRLCTHVSLCFQLRFVWQKCYL